MCGILGVFGASVTNSDDFQEMLSTLAHRGPDDIGVIAQDNFVLGHQRLSIVDVEGGHQPLCAAGQKLYGICNGEIYNFRELRAGLSQNYDFQSHVDSEILLPLYQKLGSKLTSSLDGMFSFVISDDQEFLAARDRIGIKPLYYGTTGENIYFSSEIKALVEHSDEIKEFPSGHYYHSTQGIKPYYQLPEAQTFITDLDTILEKIRQTLSQSVQKRLMSDVPVGVFLSGGLDSSIIAALMRQHIPNLHSFSVGLPNSPDLKAARLVAEHLGTIHHEYVYTEAEMSAVLPDVIYYLESFDPALVRSAIPCYIVSQLASKYVKVILSGEGADELFAGYSYFADYDDAIALHKESVTIIKGLHNLNLQRLDRMTMAHGLEGRVPFLDTDFIELSLSIDPTLKLYKTFGIEKWLLRQAFSDLLPQEIVWRDKMEFAQGCASSTVLEDHANSCITEQTLEEAQKKKFPVSSKEELFYYQIFRNHFTHPDAAALIGKWQGTLH
ncbi:asparagine synthase B [Nodularia spumigena CS-584]|uniref:asparagine synthase B n=1 Tax=Nodularia spumigena TaxID=70799 RepID=UPI0000EAD891|nr:asparagine synthase B [Nodularia spumigena]EAW47390.1 asparagine synthase B [Nodularia spumigena CCY9414]MDB9382886.1 asparagine synthase B [Nodularia spumigena CS-584]